MIFQNLTVCQNEMKFSEFTFTRIICNGPAIKQVAEGNLPEGRSDRRERSFIACWALLNGA